MKAAKHLLISSLSVAMLALLGVSLTSCTDDVVGSQIDASGTPEITGVRYVDAEAGTDPELIRPGDWVALMGNNMNATTRISFVGVGASFNPALMTDKSLVVQVPTEIPFGSLDPDAEVINTIEVANDQGHSVLDFPVVPPGPQVNGISNEFAQSGETIHVTGQYLYLIESVTFPGGVQADASTFEWAGNGTWMELTVPAGFSEEGGALDITTLGGSATSLPGAGFWNDAGLLTNFDDVNHYVWGAFVESDPATFPDATGNYGHMVTEDPINPGDVGWWNEGRSINLDSLQWVDPGRVGNPIEEYVLKFEINVQEPMEHGSIMIRPTDDWTYIARFEPWTETSDAYQTEGWETVSIPLTAFRTAVDGKNGVGDPVSSLSQLLGSEGGGAMGIMFLHDGEEGPQRLDLAIDNIRVVNITE